MATLYDFDLVCGQSFCLSATAKDSNGDPLDLSDYNFVRGGAKYKFSDNTYALNFNPSITNPTGGIIQFSFSGYQTSGINTTVMPYDVEAGVSGISGDNTCIKILRGYINTYPKVS